MRTGLIYDKDGTGALKIEMNTLYVKFRILALDGIFQQVVLKVTFCVYIFYK